MKLKNPKLQLSNLGFKILHILNKPSVTKVIKPKL